MTHSKMCRSAGLRSFALIVGFSALFQLSLNAQNVNSLIEKVSARLDSFPEFKSWKAFVVTRISKMDKDWNPKEEMLIKKNVTVENEERFEEILLAVKKKNGKTKDETEKYVKRAEKERKKRQKASEKDRNNNRNFSISLDEMFPFNEEKRDKYDFALLEDSEIEGRHVLVLQAEAKVPEEETWEGKFYIDKDNYDVLELEIKPSKNPKFVKEVWLRMGFEVNPQGYYVFKRFRMKVNGGIFIKRVRMVIQEEYSYFKVLE